MKPTETGRLCGAILAGGRATRLGGVAKGLLKVQDGMSILDRLIQELNRAGVEDVVILSNDMSRYESFGYPVVRDLRMGVGPMGGIEAGLHYIANRYEALVLLPCDIPEITAGEIRALLASYAPRREGVVFARMGGSICQPLCAIVHNALLRDISAAIDRGDRGVGRLWSSLGGVAVDFDDPGPFLNINTPDDLRAWDQPCGGAL